MLLELAPGNQKTVFLKDAGKAALKKLDSRDRAVIENGMEEFGMTLRNVGESSLIELMVKLGLALSEG